MGSVKTLLYLGVCLCTWSITTADVPEAEDVHWMSLDFTTFLKWTGKSSENRYTVLYAVEDGDWTENPDCGSMSQTECDMTYHLMPLDRIYTADIKIESEGVEYTDLEDLPHTYSPPFNPYRESNISVVKFSVFAVDETSVIINISDPLTSIFERGRQLSIRDILKKDLKYKIIYYKSGSTGKKNLTVDSDVAEVKGLDAGQSYCFMVAAYIPSRPKKANQLGAWSMHSCTSGDENIVTDLSVGALVGIIFILLTVLIIVVTVTVLCCRCCRQRNKSLQTSQSPAPI